MQNAIEVKNVTKIYRLYDKPADRLKAVSYTHLDVYKRQVVATMAIENMYLSKDFINELIKVARGEKTSEELRQEVILRHAR